MRISFYLPKKIFFLYHLDLEIQDMEKTFTQDRVNTNTSQLPPEFENLVHTQVKKKKTKQKHHTTTKKKNQPSPRDP